MLKIEDNIQKDLNAISYYYARQKDIDNLRNLITKKYDEIFLINKKIKKIEKEIETELNGLYKDGYDFVQVNGQYTTKEVHEKVREGKLENVQSFIQEKDEKSAINSYLKAKGFKINNKGELADDMLYGIENFDVEEILDEN